MENIDENDLKRAVESIVNWAYSDSHVRVDKVVLEDMLRTDFGVAGRLPTEKECELLVCGEDEGGIPEELEADFPQTYEFIGTYWE